MFIFLGSTSNSAAVLTAGNSLLIKGLYLILQDKSLEIKTLAKIKAKEALKVVS